jgi:hypothetical protein
MSLLQETIVYIWLLPVVAQIVLPLGMLLIWSIKQVSSIQFRKTTVSKSIAGNELELSGSAT